MERLTKTYSDGTHGASDNLPCGENSYDYKNLLLEKLGKYEDLEEQGRLIKLPCKVGDTVYGISMGKLISLTVNEISIFYMKSERVINVKCQNNDEFRNYVEREFGKTVFLTKSEAEAKLKELRGGKNENSNS